MTHEEYERALRGFRSNPQRHYTIYGRLPLNEAQLNDLAKKRGYVHEPAEPPETLVDEAVPAESEKAEESTPRVQPVVATEASAKPARAPGKPAAPKAPKGEGSQASTRKKAEPAKKATESPAPSASSAPGGDKTPDPAEVDIPENLGTLRFAELKALAVKLGVNPIPNVQADLLAAIEAKRNPE